MTEEAKKSRNFSKTLVVILVTFVFTCLIMSGALIFYIIKANPFNIQACIISSYLGIKNQTSFSTTTSETSSGAGQAPAVKSYDHPLLNDEQEQFLENIGIDVETLPTEISPDMIACFQEELGEERVKEIIGGATPGVLDIVRARPCLK